VVSKCSGAGEARVADGLPHLLSRTVDAPAHPSRAMALFAFEGPIGFAFGHKSPGKGSAGSGLISGQMALAGGGVSGRPGNDVSGGSPALAEAPSVRGDPVALKGFIVPVLFALRDQGSRYVGSRLAFSMSLTSRLATLSVDLQQAQNNKRGHNESIHFKEQLESKDLKRSSTPT